MKLYCKACGKEQSKNIYSCIGSIFDCGHGSSIRCGCTAFVEINSETGYITGNETHVIIIYQKHIINRNTIVFGHVAFLLNSDSESEYMEHINGWYDAISYKIFDIDVYNKHRSNTRILGDIFKKRGKGISKITVL